MTIIVTGASGFLGSWAVRALAARGHHVVALVRSPRPWRLESTLEIEIVVAPPESWPDEIRHRRPETVVSFDWAGVDGASRESVDQWHNVERLGVLVEAATAAGTRRVVAVGSQAEYGPATAPVTESSPTRPTTEYGRAKLGALALLSGQRDLEWVWARVFSVFGPLDNEGMLLPKLADALATGTPIELSSGEQRWSYLYASDAGEAMATLATHADAAGIINVGHPEAPRLRDAITRFSAPLGDPHLLRFAPAVTTGAPLAHLEPVVSRLLALGWEPAVAIDDGLTRTGAWLTGAAVADPWLSVPLPVRPTARS
ncbi:MAG: NAD-dependent epimerase/dehydratase family protein [Rhodoglobus sp.]